MKTELSESLAPEAQLYAAPAEHRARRPQAWWRLAGTPTGLTLVFDGAVFGAMGVLGWKLVMPWSEALTAGESLMAIGLIVCAGLWASICAEDLYRWRKLYRRWSAQARRALAVPVEEPPAAVLAAPADAAAARPRVRSAVLPSQHAIRALSHTPWHVVTRH